MCDVVDISARRKKSGSIAARPSGDPATTHVLVPSERLSQLREFWMQLKADIDAEVDATPQHLLRR